MFCPEERHIIPKVKYGVQVILTMLIYLSLDIKSEALPKFSRSG